MPKIASQARHRSRHTQACRTNAHPHAHLHTHTHRLRAAPQASAASAPPAPPHPHTPPPHTRTRTSQHPFVANSFQGCRGGSAGLRKADAADVSGFAVGPASAEGCVQGGAVAVSVERVGAARLAVEQLPRPSCIEGRKQEAAGATSGLGGSSRWIAAAGCMPGAPARYRRTSSGDNSSTVPAAPITASCRAHTGSNSSTLAVPAVHYGTIVVH